MRQMKGNYDIRYSMMASEVEVCEVLCFIRNNFERLTVSQLKPIIVSFYEDEELLEAKELLLKAVQRAILEVGADPELPRLPKRQGENRRKLTADDLLKLFTVIDERHLNVAIPKYTAENLSRIPFVNADSIDTVTSAKKIEVLEQRMNSLEQLLLHNTIRAQLDTGITDDMNVAHSCSDNSDNTDMVAADPQPAVGGDSGWREVTSRRRRRTGALNAVSSAMSSSSSTARSVNSGGTAVKHAPTKVIGTRSGKDASLKPGIDIVQKAVVHIDNLDSECTSALLNDYLLANDVTVLSCYKAKSWLREDERDKVMAFRVCVPAAQRLSLIHI